MSFVPNEPSAGAVAAISSAGFGSQQKHPVRIAVHQARGRRIPVFGARVRHLMRAALEFRTKRNKLSADRTIRIVGIHKRSQVRRNGQTQFSASPAHTLLFFFSQINNLGQFRLGADPPFYLPMPILPIQRVNILKKLNVVIVNAGSANQVVSG